MIARIRPYEPGDFPQVEELDHCVFPEYTGSPPWRAGWHFEAPEKCAARYVSIDPSSGRVNGYGSVRHVGSRHYRANLMVHPSCRRFGIGGALFSALWEQLAGPLDAAYLQVRVRKDQDQGLAFARSRDFEYVHEMRGRLLDLANVDLHGLESQAHRCDPDGVSISTLSELRLKNSDADAQIADVYVQSQTGWLDPDPYMIHNPPDEERRASTELVRNARPDRLHVALVNERPVGVSGETMGTAVLPDYRRRGIAGALLAARIAGLKREGVAVFFSSSAQPAFTRIYDRLGCQDWFSEIRFVKRVEC